MQRGLEVGNYVVVEADYGVTYPSYQAPACQGQGKPKESTLVAQGRRIVIAWASKAAVTNKHLVQAAVTCAATTDNT